MNAQQHAARDLAAKNRATLEAMDRLGISIHRGQLIDTAGTLYEIVDDEFVPVAKPQSAMLTRSKAQPNLYR